MGRGCGGEGGVVGRGVWWGGGVVGRGEEMKGARDENIDIYVIQPY